MAGLEVALPRRGRHARPFANPHWKGEPLDDVHLLVHAEQGIGDMLQFCRFLPIAAAAVG